jgi:SAM-dependent methyltransferase
MTTDSNTLRTRAYPDARNLEARQGLYRFQEPMHDLPGITCGELADVDRAVLDVGCGTGACTARLRRDRPGRLTVALDLSPGMLSSVPSPTVAADAAHLPFRDGAFGAVLAMHMLYHVPHIDAAVREAARVLGPDGPYVVTTNSRTDKAELHQLWRAACFDVLGRPPDGRISFSRAFTLEQAPDILARRFRDVAVTRLRSTIAVPSAEPVVDYFRSYMSTLDLPIDAQRLILDAVRREVARSIRVEGAFRIGCLGGLLVCRGVRED